MKKWSPRSSTEYLQAHSRPALYQTASKSRGCSALLEFQRRLAIAVPPERALEPTDSCGCTARMETPTDVTSTCASWLRSCAVTQHHPASLSLMGARQHQLPLAARLVGGQVPHIAGHRGACSHIIDMQRFGIDSAECQGTLLVATDLAANKR